eukprot:8426-Rhodomonas_salina.1
MAELYRHALPAGGRETEREREREIETETEGQSARGEEKCAGHERGGLSGAEQTGDWGRVDAHS